MKLKRYGRRDNPGLSVWANIILKVIVSDWRDVFLGRRKGLPLGNLVNSRSQKYKRPDSS